MKQLILVIALFTLFRIAAVSQSICFFPPIQHFISAGSGTGIYGAVTGDFNGDGFIDLITSNSTSNTISYMEGDGNGGFASSVNYATGSVASGMNKGDFNNDGDLDVVVANQGGNSLSVLLGNGNGTFNTAIPIPVVSGQPFTVICHDFDNDTIIDLAVGCYSSALIIMKGDGAGNFSPLNTYFTGAWMASINLADFNSDGLLDIALPGGFAYNIVFLEGLGGGNFAMPFSLPCNEKPFLLMAADLNNDSLPDMIASNSQDTSITVFINTGNFSFAPPVYYYFTGPWIFSPGFVTLADFNNDSIQDMLVAFGTLSGISVLPGTGNGSFSTEQHFNGANRAEIAIAVDINQDNKTDVINPSSNSPAFYVLLNCTPTGVDEATIQNTEVAVYPNPSSEFLNIKFNSTELFKFTLYNSLGKKLIDKTVTSKTSTINISAYSNGLYFYSLNHDKHVIKSGRIIKQ